MHSSESQCSFCLTTLRHNENDWLKFYPSLCLAPLENVRGKSSESRLIDICLLSMIDWHLFANNDWLASGTVCYQWPDSIPLQLDQWFDFILELLIWLYLCTWINLPSQLHFLEICLLWPFLTSSYISTCSILAWYLTHGDVSDKL